MANITTPDSPCLTVKINTNTTPRYLLLVHGLVEVPLFLLELHQFGPLRVQVDVDVLELRLQLLLGAVQLVVGRLHLVHVVTQLLDFLPGGVTERHGASRSRHDTPPGARCKGGHDRRG